MSCPSCKVPTEISYYYCPNCGKQLREDAPLSTAFGKQLKLYFVALLFPPFALWPAFKYINQPTLGAKSIGGVATLFTAGAIILITYELMLFMDIFKEFAPITTTMMQLFGY